MKEKLKTVKMFFLRAGKWFSSVIENRCFAYCIISAPIVNLIIEMLSRRSVTEGIAYAAGSPGVFLYNSLMILLPLLVASLFRKRLFTIVFVQCLFIFAGIVNFVLLGKRITPFGAADFLNLKSAITIAPIYLSIFEFVAYIAGIVGFIAVMILFWIKAPKMKVKYRNSLAAIAAGIVLFSVSTQVGLKVNAISDKFTNLVDAYDQYGFTYCFSKSLFDRGVDKPDDYTIEEMDDIAEELDKAEEEIYTPPEKPETPVPLEHPNIVMVQLESFFNVNRLKDMTFSENPIPNFTRFAEEGASGLFKVPVIGAGTVNTEFEIISGMSLEYFGTGEYPYKTILQSSACPSICYELDKYGYTNFALHNNNGTFYDRHKVYPNLGFDYFVSEEYMKNLRETPLGWMKDSILTEEIMNCLDSTSGSDFVYAVSAQPHGRYPTQGDFDSPFDVEGAESMERRIQYQYYAWQLYECDNFVNSLVKALEYRGEPYIAVFYGDHLPSLDIEDEDLSAGNKYQTEYIIVTNTGYEAEDEDLCTYQLHAKLLEMAGIPGNTLTKLHQTYTDPVEYQEKLELLEYDLLYGEKEVLGGEVLEPKDMKMGVDEIKITDVEDTEEGLRITGENMTSKSHVFVNGKPFGKTSQGPGRNLLLTDKGGLEDGDALTIVQMCGDGEPLSYSEEYIWHAPAEK